MWVKIAFVTLEWHASLLQYSPEYEFWNLSLEPVWATNVDQMYSHHSFGVLERYHVCDKFNFTGVSFWPERMVLTNPAP